MLPECGPLTDYAIIGRIDSPWNLDKSVILLCGIRGIGTWGAARFLRDNQKDISRRSKNGNFICVVKVIYKNYKMSDICLTSHFQRIE